MNHIINNIQSNLHNLIRFKFNKIQILFFLMFLFSLIYMLLEDDHFEGVNKFKELVKEEVIKDKVQKEIKENYSNLNDENNGISNLDKNLEKYYSKNKVIGPQEIKEEIKEEVIDDVAKETELEVKKDDLTAEKVEPSLYNKYLNRLYFAIITGCLLGYGDIYPITNTSKLLAGLQGLLTVSLIIY